jgi:hypothetical protein
LGLTAALTNFNLPNSPEKETNKSIFKSARKVFFRTDRLKAIRKVMVLDLI